MATRSAIGITDGFASNVRAVYCHWDGYPEHVGNLLVNHYNGTEQAEQLIAEGHISQLGPTIDETVPLLSRTPEPIWDMPWLEFIDQAKLWTCEYVYVWNRQYQEWECYGLGVTKVNLNQFKMVAA